MDPITFELSIATAGAIIIILIPAILGVLKLIKVLKENPQEELQERISSNLRLINNINKDMAVVLKDIEKFEDLMNMSTRRDNANLKSQVDDLRLAMTRLQDKMEKTTDLIIKLVTKE